MSQFWERGAGLVYSVWLWEIFIEIVELTFFDLVKQDNRVRPTADRFSELASFIVANIACSVDGVQKQSI